MPFAGKYDGGGYRILGLKSYQTGEDAATQAGLFGYNAGVIQNLRMVGGAVDGLYAGGIAGESSGRIENCRNTGAVAASFGGVAGGIVGENQGSSIASCFNAATVTGATAGGLTGKEIHGQTKSSYHTGAVVFTVKEGEKTEE